MLTLRDKLRKANQEIQSVSAEEAQQLLDSETVLFLDVREAHELQQEGTIPGAVHVSRGLLEFAIEPKSPTHNPKITRDLDVIVYCASGMRSLLSAQTLLEMGFTNVRNLDGGFTAWRNRNGPVKT